MWARERLLSCRIGGKEWGCNSLEWNRVRGQLLDKLIHYEGQPIVINRPGVARAVLKNAFDIHSVSQSVILFLPIFKILYFPNRKS